MRRSSWLMAAALVLALAGISLACALAAGARAPAVNGDGVQVAQAPEGPPGGWGQPPRMNEADRAKMREQMTERMLDQAGLTDEEKAAAKKALAAKEKARQVLAKEFEKLRAVAQKENPSQAELTDALALYPPALADYRKAVQAADETLVKQLSLKAQVRCLSLGILDNGLGGFGHAGPVGPPPGPPPPPGGPPGPPPET